MIRVKPQHHQDKIDKEYKMYYLHTKQMYQKYKIKIDISELKKNKGIKYYIKS